MGHLLQPRHCFLGSVLIWGLIYIVTPKLAEKARKMAKTNGLEMGVGCDL
jgi:hypothetical protein